MQVKGTAFNARLDFIRDRFGEDKITQVLNTIPQVKALLSSTGTFYPSRAYEYDHYIAFNQAISDVLYHGGEKAYMDMGRDSAEHALKSVHKVFLMNKDTRNFVRSLPVIYAAYYVNMGVAEVHLDDTQNVARAFVRVPERAHRSLCQIIRGYVKHGMSMCGSQHISDLELSCCCRGAPACEFEFRWQ